MKIVKTGLGYSEYVNFSKGEYNMVYIGSSSWGSGTATLVYSPDGILPPAVLQYPNSSGVVVNSNTALEIKSYDGKLGLLLETDPLLSVTLDITGENNFYN
jgi:hypothetical protein